MAPALKTIGIFGGTFNPVHIGHTIIDDYLRQICGLTEVWMMLSPLNPLKASSDEIVADDSRLEMLRLAVKNVPGVVASDFELSMPRPSYTYVTLKKLQSQFPDYDFALIIGADNWKIFNLWRDFDKIFEEFKVIIYPRDGFDVDIETLPQNVTLTDTPRMEISSTFIRNSIARGLDMNLFLPEGVYSYIKQHNLYGRK